MGSAIQGIRHASLVVAQADAAPPKPATKAKGVGQGSGAPTPPPPPFEHESNAPGRTTAETTIKKANKNQPSYKFFQLMPDNTRGVLQHEYSIVSWSAKQNQLATYGAGSCVIIAAWNPDVKKAGLAHVDALTDIRSVENFLNQVASGRKDGTKLQVHLVGGDSSSTKLQAELVTLVTKNPILELVSADLGSSGYVIRQSVTREDNVYMPDTLGGGQSLAISAKTGEISNFVDPSTIDPGQGSEARSRLVGLESSKSPLYKVPEQFFRKTK
jgi:Protein N-terminal asparagine amidohydrolase